MAQMLNINQGERIELTANTEIHFLAEDPQLFYLRITEIRPEHEGAIRFSVSFLGKDPKTIELGVNKRLSWGRKMLTEHFDMEFLEQSNGNKISKDHAEVMIENGRLYYCHMDENPALVHSPNKEIEKAPRVFAGDDGLIKPLKLVRDKPSSTGSWL